MATVISANKSHSVPPAVIVFPVIFSWSQISFPVFVETSIYPSILTAYPVQGCGGTGAYLSCHRAKCGVNPVQCGFTVQLSREIHSNRSSIQDAVILINNAVDTIRLIGNHNCTQFCIMVTTNKPFTEDRIRAKDILALMTTKPPCLARLPYKTKIRYAI